MIAMRTMAASLDRNAHVRAIAAFDSPIPFNRHLPRAKTPAGTPPTQGKYRQREHKPRSATARPCRANIPAVFQSGDGRYASLSRGSSQRRAPLPGVFAARVADLQRRWQQAVALVEVALIASLSRPSVWSLATPSSRGFGWLARTAQHLLACGGQRFPFPRHFDYERIEFAQVRGVDQRLLR